MFSKVMTSLGAQPHFAAGMYWTVFISIKACYFE